MKNWWLSQKNIAISLMIVSIVGLLASLALGYETLESYKDSSYVPSCNLNPIVSCGTAMESEWSQILGIPNPLFGIMGFTALLTMSVALLVGGLARKRLWALIGLGALGGIAFTKYLFIVSMVYTASVCPWCFVIWITSIALFWFVITYMATNKMFNFNRSLSKISAMWVKYSAPILISWYLILLIIIFLRFKEFWLSLI